MTDTAPTTSCHRWYFRSTNRSCRGLRPHGPIRTALALLPAIAAFAAFLPPVPLFAGPGADAAAKARAGRSATAAGPASVASVPEGAEARTAMDESGPHVVVQLIAGRDRVEAGQPADLGILFTIDDDWHVYWRNPGESALPTEVDWSAAPLEVGPLQWPVPEIFDEAGGSLTTYGYADELLLPVTAQVPAGADGEVEVTANVKFLACRQICVPGIAKLTRTLTVAPEAGPENVDEAPLFPAYRAGLPKTAAAAKLAVAAEFPDLPAARKDPFAGTIDVVACREGGHTDPDCGRYSLATTVPHRAFLPYVLDGLHINVASVSPHPDADVGWRVELDGRGGSGPPTGPQVLGGLLMLRDVNGNEAAVAVTVPVVFPGEGAEVAAGPGGGDAGGGAAGAGIAGTAGGAPGSGGSGGVTLWQVLLMAFAGGLILNLMPCVFPVLAIKATSFTRLAHEDHRTTLSHGAAYTAGIVGSMVALAAVVIGLRQVGIHAGWGFQFQEPLFLAALATILVLFALNLFSVFEIGTPTIGSNGVAMVTPGLRRSAGEGVLAVILATPCSAPFLGTAVGFALASSPAVIVSVFVLLGLGLAAPFVALTLLPHPAKVLPKPGPWMDNLKHVLGFALLGTAIWLVWLIGQVAGVDAVAQLLSFLLAAGIAAWAYGKVQFKGTGHKWAALGLGAAALVVIGAAVLDFDRAPAVGVEAASGGGSSDLEKVSEHGVVWQPYDEDAIAAELAEGRPVFVDFTADWCITCKVNERAVLKTAAAADLFLAHDVAVFVADWTRRDDRIRQSLAELGKAGVPVYVVYAPGRPDQPNVLPEMLTTGILERAIKAASPTS